MSGEILLIIDGMTDSSFERTYRDDMPALASMRLVERRETTPRGREPESLTCIMNILGVSPVPRDVRACADALGRGMSVGADDLAVRLSWFSVDSRGALDAPTDAPESIDLPAGAEYRCLGGYKSVVIFRGRASSLPEISTLAPYTCAGARVSSARPRGMRELEELFDSLADGSRAAVPWGQAVMPSASPSDRWRGVPLICGADVIRGMAILLGMEPITPSGATGDTDTDIASKTDAAIRASCEHGTAILHLNGADEASHRRSAEEKRDFLRRVDAFAIAPIIASGARLTATGDHGSDPATGTHTRDAQPLFFGHAK